MVGKSKNRKRAAEHFKKFSQLLRLLINVNRNTTLQRKGMEIATFLLVSDTWTFPSSFPIPFRNFSKADQ
jgi:hypothetical protein